jgi:hypothetical protein
LVLYVDAIIYFFQVVIAIEMLDFAPNETIRLLAYCRPGVYWNVPDESGQGVWWMSPEVSFTWKHIVKYLPPIEWIEDFDSGPGAIDELHTLKNDKADLHLELYSIRHQRLKYIEYGYPSLQGSGKIII